MAITTPNEGKLTKRIEKQTSKIQSGVFLAAALTTMAASVTLKCMGRNHTALLVGQWTAPLLVMGLYDKIVKTVGHD